MILLSVLIVVVGLAYRSYMSVIAPLVGRELYGWVFVAVGLLPLAGLIVVAARNLDAITEVAFRSTSQAVAGAVGGATPVQPAGVSPVCSKCGNVLADGVKFCTTCGAAVVTASIPVEPVCPKCGATNKAGAKFCRNCGTAVAPTPG
jgi:ribosomal protein L40E